MADHGPLFDSFRSDSGHPHGGSYYDEGFPKPGPAGKHGQLLDDDYRPAAPETKHGENWDRFAWKSMPMLHGNQFDNGFGTPSAFSGEHGSWFDEFRGGRTHARFLFDGKTAEGVVEHVNDDYATVRTRGGQTVEVSFQQFLEYATPNDHQAAPMIPRSTAEAPSAHDRAAHGGHRRSADLPDMATRQTVSPGPGQRGTRSAVDLSAMERTVEAVKALAGNLDVQKGWQHVGTPFSSSVPCKTCGHGGFAVGTGKEAVGSTSKFGKATCMNCGAPHDMSELGPKPVPGVPSMTKPPTTHKAERSALDVLKEMTSAETAVQMSPDAAPIDGPKGAKYWCKHCKHTCRKVTDDGLCPSCGHDVSEEAEKTADVLKNASLVKLLQRHGLPRGGSATAALPCAKCGQSTIHQVTGSEGVAPYKGRCETCGTSQPVHVGKAAASALDVLKQNLASTVDQLPGAGGQLTPRAHPSSDHAGNGERTCPHCGQVWAQIDSADQGMPKRRTKTSTDAYDDATTHKCVAGAIATLEKIAC